VTVAPVNAQQQVVDDLAAENDDLDTRVANLDEAGWRTPTPAVGWDVAHQVAHLAWTDHASLLAVTDPAGFTALLADAAQDPTGFVDTAAAEGAATPVAELLARWRTGRAELLVALAAVPSGVKIPWFGPPMSAASMATARLMETWAHGQDVADALGQVREPTARLRHVAHIGVRTHGFAHLVNGLQPPAAPVRVELTAPDGSAWTWNDGDDAGAVEVVRGTALDFCLLVTQRRHRDDLGLVAQGPVAQQWLTIAQAFAGPPGGGRAAAVVSP
jgi:uncharacterized protein (TIGR03084 family)